MFNQATLLINTLLLAMACALLSIAVKAAPADSGAKFEAPEATLSVSIRND